MKKVVDAYFHLLRFLIVVCLALMVILVFGNVVLRYGFNLGITVSEEVSRWLFVWMTFLGAIVAMREYGHLGVDTLVKRLPPLGKKLCLIVSQLLMLYATWLFLQGSWEQTKINVGVTAPASGLSAVLLLLYDLYRVVSGKMTDEELVMVKESEEQEEFEELQKELAAQAREEQLAAAAKKSG
jgi:TRAP-type transport system small permease protein